MTYRFNNYKYLILLLYGLFAILMSAAVSQDMLMILNFAIFGSVIAYLLLKQEKLLLALTIAVSIFNEGIPFVNGTYLVFFLYGLMCFSLLVNKEKNKIHYGFLAVVLVSFVLTLIPSIVNGTSIPLLLIATLKRYGFVIVFIYALNLLPLQGKFRKKIDLLFIALLLVNFLAAFLQYLGGNRTQDFITGFLGDGTTGIYIYLFMFYLAVASGLHYQKKISTPVYAALALVPLVYSAVAEVKIGFVTTAIILLIYLVFFKRGYVSFILLIGGGFALTWLYSVFASIYPEHNFLSMNFLETYLVEDAYGGGDTLNRFGFKPAVDALVFSNSQNDILFGKGLGSGNPSETEFLKGDVYRNFDYLKYSWFTMPYLYIEAGLAGTVSFLMIYILPFLLSIREFIRRKSSLALVLVLMGLTNLIYLPYNSGLFSYGITTVYWFYLAMLIQEKDKSTESLNPETSD